ncbi:MAG: nucleotide exchange factor GrpE [Planctomycetia bacterium]|nr:nucleotide exchange factor GrpE [Planctomycetia bacterium]
MTNNEDQFNPDNLENLDDVIQFNESDLQDADANDENVEEETMTITVAEYNDLKGKLAQAEDRGLRALAELENYRARTNRLQQEERKYASIDLARAILPALDNLALALTIKDPENNGQAVMTGVKMVYDDFLAILERNGIKKIDALHQPFDPNFHESISTMPSADYPPNTVIYEVKAGFTLHERVVRAAQVVISVAPTDATATQE